MLARNGLDPGGRARGAVGRVRLVHAAVRGTVRALPSWRDGFAEEPVNQEDLLGALCLFSVVVLQALERLAVPIDDRDREDFVHLWAAVGEMLGMARKMAARSCGCCSTACAGTRSCPACATSQRGSPRTWWGGLEPDEANGSQWALSLGRSLMRMRPVRGLAARFGRSLLEGVNEAKLAERL